MAVVVLMVLGAAGLFNGTALVSDSSGRTLGLRVDMLPAWHTWDYRYAGMFVLVALGILPLVCGAAILVDVPHTSRAVFVIGLITLAWVIWQIVILDVHAPIAQVSLGIAGAILVCIRFRSEIEYERAVIGDLGFADDREIMHDRRR